MLADAVAERAAVGVEAVGVCAGWAGEAAGRDGVGGCVRARDCEREVRPLFDWSDILSGQDLGIAGKVLKAAWL